MVGLGVVVGAGPSGGHRHSSRTAV